MKVVFNTIVELWDEIEMILVETGKSNLVLQYIKEEVGIKVLVFENLSIVLLTFQLNN